ncbi:SURF1 family protein [Lysobacter korlensis]|uniref:SURF1-like protein n=1 Tax=Lysobacter korlensis TaxID=553636 RepID=A0ABV6RNE5_9GAMM
MNTASRHGRDPGRRRPAFLALAFALAIACLGFVALGGWQLQRMQWKRGLIERVEARVNAAPVPIPRRSRWPQVNAVSDEYRRVRVSGEYVPGVEARTQALTELGSGSWVLSALRSEAGEVVFINRGFVAAHAQPDPVPAGLVTVTGLLRMSEPGGGFLRRNDPSADRWYSRDTGAIAQARGLPPAAAAPFFVDAAAPAGRAQNRWPRPGLTVVRFRDNHLAYALTWFALAALTAWAGLRLWRIERSGRAAHADPQEIDA